MLTWFELSLMGDGALKRLRLDGQTWTSLYQVPPRFLRSSWALPKEWTISHDHHMVYNGKVAVPVPSIHTTLGPCPVARTQYPTTAHIPPAATT